MKKLYTFISAVILSASLCAQAPQKMSYQAVIRGANNALVIDKPVGVRISILQGSETGSTVYTETHTPTTNANGLASLSIGIGKNPSSDFSKIDWSKGPYFVKTETDVEDGTNYQLTSVSELLSVPYALYAGNGIKRISANSDTIFLSNDKFYVNKSSTNIGNSSIPTGGGQGQVLTNCDGVPTWTTGGICPGKIASLNCAGVFVNGLLNNGAIASNVSFVITYSGGNGGAYLEQSISSTGVIGLTANLQVGTFATGNGSLTFSVSGTPTSVGNALFSLNIGGQVCSVSILVQEKPSTIGIPGPNITDNDGNTYKTVTIGTQTWMAENLKTSKYNDGSEITTITNSSLWSGSTTGATCYLNNDLTNVSKYGRLYNWNSISKSKNGNKNVCPVGWHVPSENEWVKLFDYLGGASVAGGKMKEVGTVTWSSPNTGATNTSLFTALPGGARLYDIGDYYYVTGDGYWWSITESNSIEAKKISLFSNTSTVSQSVSEKASGLSIRCLKD